MRTISLITAVTSVALALSACGEAEQSFSTLTEQSRAAAVAVLEVDDGSWRLAHDRLRERLLADLTDPERQALHQRQLNLACAGRGVDAENVEIAVLVEICEMHARRGGGSVVRRCEARRCLLRDGDQRCVSLVRTNVRVTVAVHVSR